MNYWIFIANQNHWDWLKDQKVGELEQWFAKSKDGKLKNHFSKVEKGDKVIGYSSGQRKSFVSMGVIESPLTEKDGNKYIEIRKTLDFNTPLSLHKANKIPPFDILLKNFRLNTTAIPLKLEEFNLLISLATETFIDSYDNYEQELNATDIEVEEALKLRKNKTMSNTSSWFRNPQISKAALKRANFTCELSNDVENHCSFIAKSTMRNFVESHHLIPMKEQEHIEYSLDNALNIVSLCPNCHKLLHYGEDTIKKEKLELLITKRSTDISAFKINRETLMKMYGL